MDPTLRTSREVRRSGCSGPRDSEASRAHLRSLPRPSRCVHRSFSSVARFQPALGGVDEEIAQLEDRSVVITPEENKRCARFIG